MADLNIPDLILDPDDDETMLARARSVVSEVSGGKLDPVHPTVDALLQGNVYLVAELLWYLNQLPQALAIENLARLSDTERSAGTYAVGTIVLQRAIPRLSSTQVPAGTLIGDYVTLEPAEIVAGTTEVSVAIQARATGAAGNVKAYGLASVTPGIPGVDSVYNPQAISGGSDLETLEAYVERAKASLWLNSALISALDFESAAAALMGEGSKALCVPLLTGSKVPDMPGHVHLFLWGPDGEPISTAKAQAIREDLGARAFAGCSLWASPGEYSETWVSLVIRVPQATRDQASLIFQALDARYRHTAAVPGATLSLRQLSNAAWTATVTEVVSCQIDHADYDKAMPHKWTIARLSTIDITLVDPVGYTETFYYGTSDAFNDPD